MRSRVLVVALCVLPTLGCGGSGASTPTSPTATGASTDPTRAVGVSWQFNGQAWQATGTPPPCPSPLIFTTPVDLSRVTSILYPGQLRGGYYKPHGGFRFDRQGQSADWLVAPINATIYRGVRSLVVERSSPDEVEYMFDFINACGIMYRFGHLCTLSDRLQQVAETLPLPAEHSRTTLVAPGQMIAQGEVLATAISMQTGVDWGVFDLRSRNAASANSPWMNRESELDPYGICWFDTLAPSDAARVRSLPPADSVSGSMSDYCR